MYGLLGFLLESLWYKIFRIKSYSGFLLGPFTPIYGVGVICILLIQKYVISRINGSKLVKLIISFLIFTLVLSIIEGLGGYLLEWLFDVELWNYTNKPYHLGKYVCLEMALVWGVSSVLFIYIIKPFMDRFIKRIPKKATYLFITILVSDFIYSWIKYNT